MSVFRCATKIQMKFMSFTKSGSRFYIMYLLGFILLLPVAVMSQPAVGNKKRDAIGRTKEKADTTHKPGAKVKRGPTNAIHPKKVDAAKPTFASVKPLLVKNTCIACHNENKRQVGPAFVEVAKRNYSVDEIVKLVHDPQPQHWPDYSTEMPPMPQVSVAEAKKIAAWIRSLGQ